MFFFYQSNLFSVMLYSGLTPSTLTFCRVSAILKISRISINFVSNFQLLEVISQFQIMNMNQGNWQNLSTAILCQLNTIKKLFFWSFNHNYQTSSAMLTTYQSNTCHYRFKLPNCVVQSIQSFSICHINQRQFLQMLQSIQLNRIGACVIVRGRCRGGQRNCMFSRKLC